MPAKLQQQPAVQCTGGQQPAFGALQGGKGRGSQLGAAAGAGEGRAGREQGGNLGEAVDGAVKGVRGLALVKGE